MSTVVTETTEIREIAEREAALCTGVIDTAIYHNTSPVNTKTAYVPVTDVPGSPFLADVVINSCFFSELHKYYEDY